MVANAGSGTIFNAPFGHLPDGHVVTRYTLRNTRGLEAQIISYGGIVTSLLAPDRWGHFADVSLGHDSLDGYLDQSPYFGALIGRYGNRIAAASFVLDGHRYVLAPNDGPHSLHGGEVGFDKVVWDVVMSKVTPAGPQLTLHYLSRDGEEGYPGNLSVTATYTLTSDDALVLEYDATSDRSTIVNLTQHTYFNLCGHAHPGDVLEHEVQINAEYFTPIDRTLIPSGELRVVAGGPFDFRKPTIIGTHFHHGDLQLEYGHGYDHNWVINGSGGEAASLSAVVFEPASGRVLEVLSNQPGLQFYTGNFLDGTITGKGGRRYLRYGAFCMEPQHFPDSPNRPAFPSTVLRPGQHYRNVIVYRFGVR